MVVVALAIVTVTVALVCMAPPKWILRTVVSVSPWLLREPQSAPAKKVRRVVNTYLEFAIAGVMAGRAREHGDTDDVARIDYVIRRAQLRMLNHLEVPHNAQEWPVLIAGVGYCDQINAAVCEVLSHSFKHAQLFATYDPKRKISPHTIGRVWSSQRNEWLYFDAFPDRPVVFRRTANGGVEYLNHPSVHYTGRQPPPESAYHLDGWVLNEYTRSFPRYVVRKLAAIGKQPPAAPGPLDPMPINAPLVPGGVPNTAPSEVPDPAPSAVSDTMSGGAPATASAAEAAVAPASVRKPAVYDRILRAYVRARADDLFGDRDEAREEYLAIADDAEGKTDPDAALLQDAARQFAAR